MAKCPECERFFNFPDGTKQKGMAKNPDCPLCQGTGEAKMELISIDRDIFYHDIFQHLLTWIKHIQSNARTYQRKVDADLVESFPIKNGLVYAPGLYLIEAAEAIRGGK